MRVSIFVPAGKITSELYDAPDGDKYTVLDLVDRYESEVNVYVDLEALESLRDVVEAAIHAHRTGKTVPTGDE